MNSIEPSGLVLVCPKDDLRKHDEVIRNDLKERKVSKNLPKDWIAWKQTGTGTGTVFQLLVSSVSTDMLLVSSFITYFVSSNCAAQS